MSEMPERVNFSNPKVDKIAGLLAMEEGPDLERLYESAYALKRGEVGPVVYFRGLIEFSNVCTKNCSYCGIRRENRIGRYAMKREEILDCARFAFKNRYGSVVLQSGERDDPPFVDFVDDLVRSIKELSGGELGITLSVGEQTPETYGRWFESGAHRYLLRIETSSRELYRRLHPADHEFEKRVDCLRALREIGYQVGTGVMIGLPFQTVEDLARDVLFFRDNDIDMIGMGPYVFHERTPLADEIDNSEVMKGKRFTRSLNMVAVTRLLMRDVNIAAATALQALDPTGREKALKAGANVIMPNLTPTKYRDDYLLYENKPCTHEDSDMCRGCLEGRISSIGETIGWDEWGDSRHFFRRTEKRSERPQGQ
jgi:biotin synthase